MPRPPPASPVRGATSVTTTTIITTTTTAPLPRSSADDDDAERATAIAHRVLPTGDAKNARLFKDLALVLRSLQPIDLSAIVSAFGREAETPSAGAQDTVMRSVACSGAIVPALFTASVRTALNEALLVPATSAEALRVVYGLAEANGPALLGDAQLIANVAVSGLVTNDPDFKTIVKRTLAAIRVTDLLNVANGTLFASARARAVQRSGDALADKRIRDRLHSHALFLAKEKACAAALALAHMSLPQKQHSVAEILDKWNLQALLPAMCSAGYDDSAQFARLVGLSAVQIKAAVPGMILADAMVLRECITTKIYHHRKKSGPEIAARMMNQQHEQLKRLRLSAAPPAAEA